MKLSLVICLSLVCLASLASGQKQREKRFIRSTFKKAVKAVHKVVDKGTDVVKDAAGDVKSGVKTVAKATAKVATSVVKGVAGISKKVYKDVYNHAKKDFKAIGKIAGRYIDFDAAVDVLTGLIDSKLTNSICEFACRGAAMSIMGPAAEPFSMQACPPLCSASLAKLEDVAEG